eukprot:352791-Chlamydomonas_euryale.AAC.10
MAVGGPSCAAPCEAARRYRPRRDAKCPGLPASEKAEASPLPAAKDAGPSCNEGVRGCCHPLAG